MKPSEQLSNLINGTTPYDQAMPGIRSWFSFWLYTQSARILKLPKQQRLLAIEQLPECHHERVKHELTRIHLARQKKTP